jgi:hypothetical protein
MTHSFNKAPVLPAHQKELQRPTSIPRTVDASAFDEDAHGPALRIFDGNGNHQIVTVVPLKELERYLALDRRSGAEEHELAAVLDRIAIAAEREAAAAEREAKALEELRKGGMTTHNRPGFWGHAIKFFWVVAAVVVIDYLKDHMANPEAMAMWKAVIKWLPTILPY